MSAEGRREAVFLLTVWGKRAVYKPVRRGEMVFYFSGTGNSKYVAQRLADALEDTLLSMNERVKAGDTSPIETGNCLIIATHRWA